MPPQPRRAPLNPDTPEGRAAAAALTDFLATVEPAVAERRRTKQATTDNQTEAA